MKVVKSITSIDFNIQIKFTVSENIIIQTFIFLPKKYLRYLYDTRYILNSKIEELIAKCLLSNFENIDFVDRVDDEKFIEMRYIFNGEIDFEIVKPFFATIHFTLPPNLGCEYCIKAEAKGDYIYCPEKNKTYLQPIKRCAVFKQAERIIT